MQPRKLEGSLPCFIQTRALEKKLLISMMGQRKSWMKSSRSAILGSNLLKVTVGVQRNSFHLECEPGNFQLGVCRISRLRLRVSRNQYGRLLQDQSGQQVPFVELLRTGSAALQIFTPHGHPSRWTFLNASGKEIKT